METIRLPKTPVWRQFKAAAQRRRHNPTRLLLDYMRECLEVWADQQLDTEIMQDAQRSGRRESEAVEIVRGHRRGVRV